MSHRMNFAFVGLCCVVAALASSGQVAEPGGGGAVTGMGLSTLKRTPDLVRVRVQISGDGKNMKEALAKLATRRESCRKKLLALGAKEEAITIEDPRLDVADPRQQMEQMMRARMMNRGNKAATAPGGATRVTVAAFVKVEWPITVKSGEELLIFAQDLQEKVKSADLADSTTASLEEQEAREERAGNDGEEQGPAPGQPMFIYVAKVTAEQRAQLLADAFKKAKANATELAAAAGSQLGTLKQLGSQAAPDMEQYQMMQYSRYGYGYNPAQSTDPNEAVSAQPGPVSMNLTVSASFAIK